jgi:hypothetical protein
MTAVDDDTTRTALADRIERGVLYLTGDGPLLESEHCQIVSALREDGHLRPYVEAFRREEARADKAEREIDDLRANRAVTAPAFLQTKTDRERAVLHLLQASSCFRSGELEDRSVVCGSLPCACAESLVALLACYSPDSAARAALFPEPTKNGDRSMTVHDADENLSAALYDLRRTGADAVCIKTIERVLEQLRAARAALLPSGQDQMPHPIRCPYCNADPGRGEAHRAGCQALPSGQSSKASDK